MVDGKGIKSDLQQNLKARVETGPDTVSMHDAFCHDAVFGTPQGPAWIRNWSENADDELIHLIVSIDGTDVMRMPLAITEGRFGRSASVAGGRHANGNFPALKRNSPPMDPECVVLAMKSALVETLPDLKVLSLERLQPEIAELKNPLITSRSQPSTNIALAVDLAGGFDAVLSRHSGKRRRKKHRSDERKFSQYGEVQTFAATTPEQTDDLLDAFFVMKAERFAEMGIDNVFAAKEIKGFFKRAFAQEAGSHKPHFILHALTVGDEVRAVTGSTISDNRMICEFSGFTGSVSDNTSPGDFLFFDVIRWACEQGFAVFDFSVGDEPYKRQWCDIETVQRDTFVPLGFQGQLIGMMQSGSASMKRRIKNTPVLWQAYKTLRKVR